MASQSPCLSCGACCAYFRVVFYWREAEQGSEYHVPADLTEEVDPIRRCMAGTSNKTRNRCAALEGKVGKNVSCRIYQNRPSPCREFQASYENGQVNKKCAEARAAYQLSPLTLKDWAFEDQQDLSKSFEKLKDVAK